MFQSLDVFVLSCLLFIVETRTGLIRPPENVSLLWITDFDPQLSWTPSEHPMKNCTHEVNKSITHDEVDIETSVVKKKSSWTDYVVMEGGFLHLSVKTICSGEQSAAVVIDVDDPELARDLRCHIHSSKHTRCSWTPAAHAPDLRFYYELVNEDLTTSINDTSPTRVQACPSYTHTDGVRTGCGLQANVTQAVHILFNGTVDDRPVRNTFRRSLKSNVRPPPLEWEVEKTGGWFLISWTPPDISDPPHWTFRINYTACDVTTIKDVVGNNTAVLRVVPHCLYRMAIKGVARGAEMPWSEEKYFNADADTDGKAMLYAAIISPLLAVSLAALTFVCWKKHKDKLFPKVPKPRDLLSDLSDNYKAIVSSLYIMAEEENCEISLVMDPQNSRPVC